MNYSDEVLLNHDKVQYYFNLGHKDYPKDRDFL